MKKRDLVRAAQKGWPDTMKIINNLFRAINEALIKKEKVTIYNFGEFYVIRANRKEVYDFKNKRRVPFAGKFKIKFRPSPTIDKLLNTSSLSDPEKLNKYDDIISFKKDKYYYQHYNNVFQKGIKKNIGNESQMIAKLEREIAEIRKELKNQRKVDNKKRKRTFHCFFQGCIVIPQKGQYCSKHKTPWRRKRALELMKEQRIQDTTEYDILKGVVPIKMGNFVCCKCGSQLRDRINGIEVISILLKEGCNVCIAKEKAVVGE